MLISIGGNMDQNNIDKIENVPQPVENIQNIDAPQPQMTVEPVKKSNNKTLLKIVIIIMAVLITSATGYFTYGYFNSEKQKADDSTSKNVDTTTETSDEPAVINPAVEAANSILTGSSVSESSLTSTDDSSILDETSDAAGSVGDSIDENSF